jgi:hypothetical protein
MFATHKLLWEALNKYEWLLQSKEEDVYEREESTSTISLAKQALASSDVPNWCSNHTAS